MSTLAENVAKVTAAHAALKTAIAAKGVAVPEGTKLSAMPALVGEIPSPSPVGWGRPLDWPRIDLIEIGKTDPDVCYFIVQKPSDTVNHGFSLLARTSDGEPWRMDRISVAADGSSVQAVAGTEQTANSKNNITLQFPDADPAGTVYAVRVSSPTGAYFSLSLPKPQSSHVDRSEYFISGVVLEAIVHQTSTRYLAFGSGSWMYSAPRHIVYTGCPKGPASYLCRGMTYGPHLIEFRKGSLMEVVDNNNPAFTYGGTVLEMDDDVHVLMNTVSTYSSSFIRPDSSGKIDTLERFVDKATGLPVDWSTVNASSCFNSCNQLTSVSLPAGFGSAATNVSNCFSGCVSLVSLALPTGFGQNATNAGNCFYTCGSLTDITGNPNFRVSVSLSHCTKLTHDSLMVVINGLQTVTTTQKLTLGATNLAKLTDDEKKVATDKGWTLA